MTKTHRKIFYPTIFSIGIILMYFQIQIFRNTIINWLVPASIIIVVGIIAYRIDFKNYKEIYFHYKTIKLFALINYFIGFGFIGCSFFMLTNYYLADKNARTESYRIVDRTSIRGGTKYKIGEEQPVFTINYNGIEKELVFNNQFFDKMNQYTTVDLKIRKGFFGFNILEKKELN